MLALPLKRVSTTVKKEHTVSSDVYAEFQYLKSSEWKNTPGPLICKLGVMNLNLSARVGLVCPTNMIHHQWR